MQGHVQAKLLLDDCYQDIDADGDPDLRPHSVLGSAVEAFDAQVLLDPLEEQFHLPSAPVQGANGQRRQRKLVGQEPVSYTHLRAHETVLDLVCRLLLEKKKQKKNKQ